MKFADLEFIDRELYEVRAMFPASGIEGVCDRLERFIELSACHAQNLLWLQTHRGVEMLDLDFTVTDEVSQSGAISSRAQ